MAKADTYWFHTQQIWFQPPPPLNSIVGCWLHGWKVRDFIFGLGQTKHIKIVIRDWVSSSVQKSCYMTNQYIDKLLNGKWGQS